MDDDEIIPSCGCVFCDLDLEPEIIDGEAVHTVDDDINGNGGVVPCTKGK